ncbi:MAG: hypothetical protein Q8M11_07310 [Sulfuritalea sp.]|nr:hypothetical protein [Sulfuritalea sp.]MDP1983201.1 hypothetical protein [Sulfuritalea sp.]
MFLEQLVRLMAWLGEFFVVLVLLVLLVIGVGLWSHDFPRAGMVIAGGAIWFIVSAVKSKR